MVRILSIVVALLLWGCAQIEPLQGGPRDKYAPAIDTLKSYPSNGQLNFSGDEVKLKFNEYISLNNPSENIIIVPQPTTPPIISSKNKVLKIAFQEPLQENTTYNITFNGAIQDLSEKNDSVFQYVFSTGDYIDSLSVSGTIRDAQTNALAENYLIGLYPESELQFDSIPMLTKPYYLAQSTKDGSFEMNYLKEETYAIFAFQDGNKNLKLDPNEKRAFSQRLIALPDSNSNDLFVFSEAVQNCIIEDVEYEYPGKLTVVFSSIPQKFNIEANPLLIKDPNSTEDSLIYWLSENPTSKTEFYTNLNEELDTLKPIMKNIPDQAAKVELSIQNNLLKGKLLPKEQLKLYCSEPVGTIDTSLINCFDQDSVKLGVPTITTNCQEIEFSTYGTAIHRMVIDSAAISSVFGTKNSKAIDLIFENHEEDYYGNLIVNVDTVFDQNVIVELRFKDELVDSRPFQEVLKYDKLLPRDYELKLIFDLDQNGEWTTGNLSEQRQPEKVLYFNGAITVKSKWDKEVDWLLND